MSDNFPDHQALVNALETQKRAFDLICARPGPPWQIVGITESSGVSTLVEVLELAQKRQAGSEPPEGWMEGQLYIKMMERLQAAAIEAACRYPDSAAMREIVAALEPSADPELLTSLIACLRGLSEQAREFVQALAILSGIAYEATVSPWLMAQAAAAKTGM